MIRWLPRLVARLPLRVHGKLLFAFLAIVGLLIAVGAVGLQVLSGVNRRAEDMVKLQRKIAAYRQLQHDTTSQLYGVSSALLVPDDRTLEARFSVENGYYLYRDKIQFALDPAVPALGAVDLPPGKEKVDEFFGKVQTYRGDLVVKLPLAQAAGSRQLVLVADSQGCADVGVCYPVTRQKVTLMVPEPGKGPGAVVEAHPRKKNWFN